MIDLGYPVFVQSDDKKTDGCKSLKERLEMNEEMKKYFEDKNNDKYAKTACETWLDVRSFGQVFAFKDDSASVGVRGPVSIHPATSISPVDIISTQITKSVNSVESDGKASDTMGMKHRIGYGLYEIKGSINCQLAEKTGFSDEDAEIIKQCLETLFENDASSARPDGSMEVNKLCWWKHKAKTPKYSSATVHRCLKAKLKDGVDIPKCYADYDVTVEKLDGLDCLEIDVAE